MLQVVNRILVLGGGSAGFMAALALKTRVPAASVRILRSPELEIIGVGEGSTAALTDFLHQYLRVPSKTSHELAAPTWKLGLKFLHWGRANTSIILLDPDWKFALCQNSGNRTDSTATKISIIRTRIPR